MDISNFTHALRSIRTGDAINSATSIRVERTPCGHTGTRFLYQATGSRAALISSGVAESAWFPQGRKRVAYDGGWTPTSSANQMHWKITKRVGDFFELTIWDATAEQRKLLDALVPAETIVPPTLEEVAREQAEAVEFWGHLVETTWKVASTGDDFRLSERDQERFLEALRTVRAILNTATIVNVKQEQAALSDARRDQTFQQFMLIQGLRDFSLESED